MRKPRVMFKQQVQGFAVGAAVVAALMVGVPALSAPSENTDVDTFAASVGVDIVWTEINPCNALGLKSQGCFTPTTPNTVYVAPSGPSKKAAYAAMHEIAHALQYRRGVALNECNADEIARLLGAPDGWNVGLKCG